MEKGNYQKANYVDKDFTFAANSNNKVINTAEDSFRQRNNNTKDSYSYWKCLHTHQSDYSCPKTGRLSKTVPAVFQINNTIQLACPFNTNKKLIQPTSESQITESIIYKSRIKKR